MMKKMIAAVFALMMVFSLALASEEAAQPFTVYPPKAAQAVFEFEGNPTTGYRWTAFLVKDGVAELKSVEGEYTEFAFTLPLSTKELPPRRSNVI